MMKYLIPATAFIASALFSSCSKKDKNNSKTADQFTCDIMSSSFPAGDSARVFIPNAFSPNGDGLNDRFFPIARNIKSIEWSIYDSNNIQLYSAVDTTGYWAGPVNAANGMTLYHYKIKAVSNQGDTMSRCGNLYTFSCIPNGYNYVDTLIFGDQYNPNVSQGYLSGATLEANATFIPCN
jgi:hypothetical protein